MKKLIAVALLVVGIGLGAIGAYKYFFNEDQERCLRSTDRAIELFNQAAAATGTSRGRELLEEFSRENAVVEVTCRNASQTRRRAMLMGLGGVASIIISVVLLFISRKRTA